MKPSYVMYDGKRNVVGMAYVIEPNDKKKPAILKRLFVSPEYRGKGHGRALLNAVTIDADREFRNLMLTVEPDDGTDLHRLVKLYLEFGFHPYRDLDAVMVRQWRQLPRVTTVTIPQPRRRRSLRFI